MKNMTKTIRQIIDARRRGRKVAGYTLLEILIAIVIIGIGFLALIAVQLGALRGFISARDSLHAAEVGRRTADLLRVQGQQWIDGNYAGGAAYAATASPFDLTDPIGTLLGTSEWVSLYTTPSDFATGRVGLDPNFVGGKYCVFARGGQMTGEASIHQYQIAVVYAAPNATLLSCDNDSIDRGDLGDVGSTAAAPALDAQGLRVSYYGTVVVRRSHLATE